MYAISNGMDKVKKALRNDVTIIENYSFHENMMVLKAKKKKNTNPCFSEAASSKKLNLFDLTLRQQSTRLRN